MDSKQIYIVVAIVVVISVAMIATPVMAQNMSGGNMTGSISGYEEDAECSKSPACIT